MARTSTSPEDWPLPAGVDVLLTSDPDESVLTDEERLRLATFGHAGRRRQFVLGRTAARRLAAARLGCGPIAVPLAVDADGAPRLPGAHISIAHAGRAHGALGAAAVADRPVGIDVEGVRARRPDLWRRLLRPNEYGLLDALGGPTDEAQTLLWVLKEAVLKAQRTGFRAGAQSVVLQPRPDGTFGAGAVRAESDRGAWELYAHHTDGVWTAVAWLAP